jgi:hypothetical protein
LAAIQARTIPFSLILIPRPLVPLRPEALNQLWERFADTLLSSDEITPEIAYAMKKTGLLVTEQNEPMLTEAQRKAWRDALHEYMAAHPMSNSR